MKRTRNLPLSKKIRKICVMKATVAEELAQSEISTSACDFLIYYETYWTYVACKLKITSRGRVQIGTVELILDRYIALYYALITIRHDVLNLKHCIYMFISIYASEYL